MGHLELKSPSLQVLQLPFRGSGGLTSVQKHHFWPWIERWPVNQGGAGSIPGQGKGLDFWEGSRWGTGKTQPHIVSLPFSLPSLL